MTENSLRIFADIGIVFKNAECLCGQKNKDCMGRCEACGFYWFLHPINDDKIHVCDVHQLKLGYRIGSVITQ